VTLFIVIYYTAHVYCMCQLCHLPNDLVRMEVKEMEEEIVEMEEEEEQVEEG